MATIITNQATLNYKFGTASASTVSNITSAVLSDSVDITKTALDASYRAGENITYIVNIKNNGATTETIPFVDDLGTYVLNGNSYTPLTYENNARLFINGVESQAFNVVMGANNVTFNLDSLPSGANAQIIYEVSVNEYAPAECGSQITNTITSECECICGGFASATETITADCYADIRIYKSVCPNPIICGEGLTYTFDIYNYGNIDATDVILTDTFTPPLTDISVSVDGNVLAVTDYSYVNGVLTLPAEGSEYSLSIPAATFVQDPQTGLYTTAPGHVQIIVSGNIA